MVDSELIAADGRARRAALDVGRSFIVQAPAGSGKTELLIQRYLKLLAIVDEPEEIIAITFTRKAAAEMRERVAAALSRAGQGIEPAKPHERITHRAAAAAAQRDRERQWSLTRNPRRMRIETLDAFCAGVARLLPVTAAAGSSAGIVQDVDADALYGNAALATLDWLQSDGSESCAVAQVLAHLDNDTGRYVDYVARMLATRDQWLTITGSGDIDDDDALRRTLEGNIASLVTETLRVLRRRFARAAGETWIPLAAGAAENLQRAGRDSHPGAALAGLEEIPGAEAGALPAWRGLAALLLTGKGEWRRRLTAAEGFPPDDRKRKEAWLELTATLAGDPSLLDLLASVTRLPEPAYSDRQWQALTALFRVLPLAVSELRRLFAERSVCDYVEIALSAEAAIGDADSPGELALMLDHRIRHLLVDEMQDTSIGQYRMLETLTAGWTPGDGRTFFCVGDPMQSIYRFRNAEVGQFVHALAEGLPSLPLEPLVLHRNFRSGQVLVDWFNDVFSDVFPGADDPASGAVKYTQSASTEEHTGLGVVDCHALLDASVDAEGDLSCSIIERCLAAGPQDTVGVLVRSRTQLPALLAELRRRGIAHEAVEIDRLTDLPEIIDVLALTRALCHVGDRAAWLGILRAPWIGLTWTDLHRLVHDAPDAAVIDLLNDPSRLARLSDHAQSTLPEAIGILNAALAPGRLQELRDRVERTWYALRGPATARAADDIENVARFLDLLSGIEEAGTLADPASLRERLDAERVSSTAQPGCRVAVMTMHKAKGLQFDHVVLPSLGRYTSGGRKSVLSWLNLPGEGGEQRLIISPIGPSDAIEQDPLHAYIEAARKSSDSLELDRLLYVACTRARKSLQLCTHVESTADGDDELRQPDVRSLLRRLWPAVGRAMLASLPQPVARNETSADDETVLMQPTLKRLDPGWRLPDPPPLPRSAPPIDASSADSSTEITFEWVGSAARHAGTIVHRWLHRLTVDGGDVQWPAWEDIDRVSRRWAAEMGVTEQRLEDVSQRVRAALDGIAGDEQGRWLLTGAGHAELGLTGLVQGDLVSVVIDRVRFCDRRHWIVDYKTSVHGGGDLERFLQQEARRYRAQLQRYRSLYRAWSGAPDVATALYFPMLQRFVEVQTDSPGA